MVVDSLPADVEALLRTHIESYEQLAMLLLVRSDAARNWSPEDLAGSLRIASHLADDVARELCSADMLCVAAGEPQPRYRYAATGNMASAITRLSQEYARNPLGVVKALSANAIQRVRTSALRAFADAFVMRKKERDDG